MLCFAKVPAKDLVEDAKAASRKDPCAVLEKIAGVKASSADAPLYAVLRESGLLSGINIRTTRVGNTLRYPYLEPREFLELLGAKGFFHRVSGLPVDDAKAGLEQFWAHHRLIFPDHPIYNQYMDLCKVIPYYLHGDGGRGFKKEAIEIFSMFPCLGSGTRLKPVDLNRKRKNNEQPVLGINMMGNSGSTRFLFSVISSQIGKLDSGAFDSLMHLWGQKLQSLLSDGFEMNGETWRVCVLGFTGDSPFVKKVGHLDRTFNNVRKTHSSTRDQKGCCWLCQAGKETSAENYPFEHLGYTDPSWIATQGINNIPLPWPAASGPGPLLHYILIPEDDLPAFFRPDLFHVFHAGVGKDFIGSSLVYIMKQVFNLKSFPKNLEHLNSFLHTFLQDCHVTLHLGRNLTEDTLGYSGTREYPEGHWSKNMDTASLMRFIIWLLQLPAHHEHVRRDSMLSQILLAALAMGNAMKKMLTSDYFTASDDCLFVIKAGHTFLSGYQTLATMSYDMQLCLFKYRPKIHYLNHVFLTVKDQWLSAGTAINPCAEATFMSEDFVGQTARLSRRVNPRAVAVKTLQRYDAWVQTLLDKEEIFSLDLSWL